MPRIDESPSRPGEGADLVVIPCGGAKENHACPAGEMYTGGYHKACRAFAESIVKPGGMILILSAKYGLLRLTDQIEPYELRMGKPGSVTPRFVRDQAERMGLIGRLRVVALGGIDYTRVCRSLFPDCLTPLKGVGGIGKQLAKLKEWTNAKS